MDDRRQGWEPADAVGGIGTGAGVGAYEARYRKRGAAGVLAGLAAWTAALAIPLSTGRTSLPTVTVWVVGECVVIGAAVVSCLRVLRRETAFRADSQGVYFGDGRNAVLV